MLWEIFPQTNKAFLYALVLYPRHQYDTLNAVRLWINGCDKKHSRGWNILGIKIHPLVIKGWTKCIYCENQKAVRARLLRTSCAACVHKQFDYFLRFFIRPKLIALIPSESRPKPSEIEVESAVLGELLICLG